MLNVVKNTQHLLPLLTKTPWMLYMVLVCFQNCLFVFKINLIGKFFNPEFTLTLQGCYIIIMVKVYLHKHRIFPHELIPSKNFLLMSST